MHLTVVIPGLKDAWGIEEAAFSEICWFSLQAVMAENERERLPVNGLGTGAGRWAGCPAQSLAV